MKSMPTMRPDEAGTHRPCDVTGFDRVEPCGATTTLRAVNGNSPIELYGAALLDIFRCARPEA